MAKPRKINQNTITSTAQKPEGERYSITGQTIATLGSVILLISGGILYVLNGHYNTRERELAVDYREKIENERENHRKSLRECDEEVTKIRGELRELQFLKKQDSIKKEKP